MTSEKAILDVAICKLNRNPSKNNIRVFLESNEDIFRKFGLSRQFMEERLANYFNRVSYPQADKNLKVGRLSDMDVHVLESITKKDIVMVSQLPNEDCREKVIAIKFVFGGKASPIILPEYEEFNLDNHMDTKGIMTKDIKKWYYIDSADLLGPVPDDSDIVIGRTSA
jgi:hypothetical protein